MATQESGALMKVLAGILEDAVRALQRIEKKIGDQSKLFNEFTEKIGRIESVINNSLSTIAQKEIPSLEKNISQKIDDLGIHSLDQIDQTLDHTIMKLQKSIQLLSIQNLVSRIENLTTVRSVPTPIAGKEPQKKEPIKLKPAAKVETGPPKVEAELSPPPIKQAKKPKKKKEEESEEALIKPSTFFGT
ncbi:MAG: hypothetical protein HWN67_18995 [Candidatus Helarchaeota archaeon]|nr:hypothetical protein [Candidatus Helarchaeota archaeon]